MNPLTAHLEKKQQPPLIEEEAPSLSSLESYRRKPFSNCLLFVLLAVFVFLLACFAVYTAVAMGISVERNQTGSAKSEALMKPAIILPTDKSVLFPEGINRPEIESLLPEGVKQRMRIQIFIKGNGENESKGESSESQENKREETFFNHPRGRFIFRKVIIHQNGLDKPEISSSEEVSQGSPEEMKEVFAMKPIVKADPFDFLFNIFRLDNIIKMMEKQNNNPQIEKNISKPILKHQPAAFSKEQGEQSAISLEKEKNALEKFIQSERLQKSSSKEEEKYERKPKAKTNELKEKTSAENLDPMIEDIMNVVESMISGIHNQEKNNGNKNIVSHQSYRVPTNIRIIRLSSPHSREGNSDFFSPMQVPHNMIRPFFLNNKMSSSSEKYSKIPNFYPTQPTSTPSSYDTNTPARITTPRSGSKKQSSENEKDFIADDENNVAKKTKETSRDMRDSPMIDRVNTENIKPFEHFFNNMFKN